MEGRAEAEMVAEGAGEVKVGVRVAGERVEEGTGEVKVEVRVAEERVEAVAEAERVDEGVAEGRVDAVAEERVEERVAGEREAEVMASREAPRSLETCHSPSPSCSRPRNCHPAAPQWGRDCPGSAPSSSVEERPGFSASGGVVPC